MYKVKKLLHIAVPVLILEVVIAFAVVVFINPHRQKQYIARNCPGYETHSGFVDQTRFVDCRGVIGIEQYTKDNFLSVFVNVPGIQFSTDFQTLKYKFVGNYMYYLEDLNLQLGYYIHSEKDDSYITTLPLDGKQKAVFLSVQDIPLYRKIDITTGKFTLYKTLDDVPVDERDIFQLLMNSK